MILKEKLNAEPGFQYVIDSLELMSAAGRRHMLAQPFMTGHTELEAEYENISRVVSLLGRDDCRHAVATVRHQLMQMHDLQGTLANLEHKMVLEEIELFEIKNFCFLCMETAKAAKSLAIDDMLSLPDTSGIFSLLDPDNTGIPNFYIYDSYHPDLPTLRQQLKAKQTLLDASHATAETNAALQREINDLFDRQNAIQQQVTAELSQQLHTHFTTLSEAYSRMAYTDLLFAKATLAKEWNLCRPQMAADGGMTELTALWNPRLRHRNEQAGLRYQAVDVSIGKGVCLITGANMAGKTVLLKTVGTAQLLAQFGFFVPAASAHMQTVDDVVFCIGDEQNEMNGLSSFASEIIKISDALRRSDSEKLLILIDEPARTTNPVEGKAIVQAMATLLDGKKSQTLVTTHYSQLGLTCRRMRVKGFIEQMADTTLTPDNINQFMDYSLIPDTSDDVPQEALRIADILHCDKRLLDTARHFLE